MSKVSRLRSVQQHTPGEVRYFTYWLHWPDGSDPWVDQTPFVHDLQFELKNTRLMQDPLIPAHVAGDLIRTGEATWFDRNGVRHLVQIEKTQRNRRWGVRRR